MTPDEDRALSPHTGWTRWHWADRADRLLAALEPHRSPAGARFDLPGPASFSGRVSDGIEGFARSFLLAGFRVAGERGTDPAGLLQRYAEGLAAGTDPRHPEAWPRPDELPQVKVEAASIALILRLTKPWLWDRLDSAVQERTVAWLATVIGQSYPPINWVWFRVIVESFLRDVGGPWSAEDIEADLAVHASLRRSGGWLSDGDQRAYDHYTGWALHLYPLLWTHLFDVTGSLCPPALRERWAGDLRRYLDDVLRLIGADGSPLLQGRSLIYRFAAAAPLWTGALTGVGGPPPGLTRRAASGMLRHFEAHGAPDEDGLLTLGWHGAWPQMRQAYSGPGSPYWAAKGMLGLAIPADHPVWTSTEEPLPVETGDQSRLLTAPGWLLSARAADGIATVLNHGTDHAFAGADQGDSPLYARLGYSTATVPPLAGDTVGNPLDNAVVILDTEGRATHRTGFSTLYTRELAGGALAAASRGSVRWLTLGAAGPDFRSTPSGEATEGPTVTVVSVLRDGAEVRLVRADVTGDAGTAAVAEPAWRVLRMGGWPVPSTEGPPGRTTGGAPAMSARASTPALRSSMYALRGLAEGGVALEKGTSPLGAWTAVPWLATTGVVPLGEVLAALVVLDRPGAAPARHPGLAVLSDGHGGHLATVTWSDGLTTEVRLPPVAAAATQPGHEDTTG